VEADHCRIINNHSLVLNDMRETVEALDRTTTAVGEGLNLAVSRIDATSPCWTSVWIVIVENARPMKRSWSYTRPGGRVGEAL